jgi:hypothetical protein
MGNRLRKGRTGAFVEAYLGAHPGSRRVEVVKAGVGEGLHRSSLYRAIAALVEGGQASKAKGRLWLGQIGHPDVALAAEVAGTLVALCSAGVPEEAKLGAAQQLSRGASRASALRSNDIIALLRLAASLPDPIRAALLPFAQRALGHGLEQDRGYARAAWEAASEYLDPFLASLGDEGTMAWNAVYAAVDKAGFLGDEELLALAGRAILMEARGGLPEPSASRAVLRRLWGEERLRDLIRGELVRRMSAAGVDREKEALRRLFAELDPEPFSED